MAIHIKIILLLIIVSVLTVGILVIKKNPRSIINRSFSIFLLGIVFFIGGFLLMGTRCSFDIFDKTIHYGGLTLLLGLFLFSQVFPNRETLPQKRWPLYIPFIVIAVGVIPFDLLIKEAPFSGGEVIPSNGPLLFPYMIFWGVYFLLSVYFLIRTYIATTGKMRMQMKYLFTGIIIVLVCFFIFDLVFPLAGISSLALIGPVSSVILVWLAGYAIIKHQLLDIRIIIQRGLIYIVLFSIIFSSYVILLQLLGYLLHKAAGMTAVLSAGIVMIGGIFLVRPLEDYFRKITDSIFFKDKYDYPDALHKLSKVLHTNVSAGDIIQNSSTLLKAILKTEWVAFRLLENGEIRSDPGALVSTNIVFEGKRIGVLELGPKKSGDHYTPSDMKLLDTFAFQAAVALEKGKLYERVEDYNTRLEQLVEKRTLEIKKLQEDQKQAMIDISHNLQTPLAVIKGEIDLLSNTPLYTDKIKTVKKSITHVSLFIRQLLHLSKLDHAAFHVTLTQIDLSLLIREQIEYFEVMAAEKGIRITTSLMEKVTIRGNKRLLNELLTNLISNAIKYSKNNSKENTIEIFLSEDTDGVRLIITDDGVGISEKDLPDIFTRFYRGSRNSNTAGTGLGLAISKKIVEKHKGTIKAESALGEYTSFTILFPLSKK